MNNIKNGSIVFNLLTDVENSPYKVGDYSKQYDVRIMEEMITEKTLAKVLYVDNDGAIVTQEFGHYAFPGDALRLATEDEFKLYEEQKYSISFDFKGEKVKAPIELAKLIVDGNIPYGSDNKDGNEALLCMVNDRFDNMSKTHKEFMPVLANEICQVIHKRGSSRRTYSMESVIVRFLNNKKDVESIKIIEEGLFAKPIDSEEFYRLIETRENTCYEIPAKYADVIQRACGYKIAVNYKGMLLSKALADGKMKSRFPHFGSLVVDEAGINCLFTLYSNEFVRQVYTRLNLNMEMLQVLLKNPRRDFPVSMSKYFVTLSWEEIMDNRVMFLDYLYDRYELESRVSRGKYVSPEFIGALLASRKNANLGSIVDCTKSEIKLKDVITYLEGVEGNLPTLKELSMKDSHLMPKSDIPRGDEVRLSGFPDVQFAEVSPSGFF